MVRVQQKKHAFAKLSADKIVAIKIVRGGKPPLTFTAVS
jgi:hypothetical protein